jgi:hypothetical protein
LGKRDRDNKAVLALVEEIKTGATAEQWFESSVRT